MFLISANFVQNFETKLLLYKIEEQFMKPFLVMKPYPEWPHRQCVGLAFRGRTFVSQSVQ